MKTTCPRLQASRLLHHLLNQSLSGLDFCILWQELVESAPELEDVDREVAQFLQTAELGHLDKALAQLPEPPEEVPLPLETRGAVVQSGWEVHSTRIRDVSRAEFRCRKCGWEIAVSQEHEANTEMRLPFDNFSCPYCELEDE